MSLDIKKETTKHELQNLCSQHVRRKKLKPQDRKVESRKAKHRGSMQASLVEIEKHELQKLCLQLKIGTARQERRVVKEGEA